MIKFHHCIQLDDDGGGRGSLSHTVNKSEILFFWKKEEERSFYHQYKNES